jgi:hypothetical protein
MAVAYEMDGPSCASITRLVAFVIFERGLWLLYNGDFITIARQDLRHGLPAGTIGEEAVNEDDVLDQRRACRMREAEMDKAAATASGRVVMKISFLLRGICRMGGKLCVTGKIILLVGW